ncbi:MarR family winged helix-turn-helix transcriptional regulator [Streptomyces blattellae]|uniref:MarR family winged helix-turn-helix transcriptional regulator n=1 Tax=Streptomyces blattellae TaxID=2569855 RepID=UPI0012B7D0A8|nr:MarR family transcriptional regulator [Streptomyces blattellae]
MDSPVDKPLGYLLNRVAGKLRTEVATTLLDPLELTLPGYVCMRALSLAPGSSSAELAREANVSPQAMNKVIHALQRRGLVTRPASVPSGRSLPATLTREGTTMLARLDPKVAEAEDRVLAALSEQDRRTLRQLLAAVD